MGTIVEWKDKLRAKGIRCTRQRVEILTILIQQTKPLTAKEIYSLLEKAGISLRLSTIYRTLNILEENEFVKKLNLNSEEIKFELLGSYHHHHLICVNCNEIVSLDCPLREYGEQLRENTGYEIKDHSIKFYGLCPNCQPKK